MTKYVERDPDKYTPLEVLAILFMYGFARFLELIGIIQNLISKEEYLHSADGVDWGSEEYK